MACHELIGYLLARWSERIEKKADISVELWRNSAGSISIDPRTYARLGTTSGATFPSLARKKKEEKCFDLRCRFHSVGRAARWNKARMWKEMYKSVPCTLGMVPECGEFLGEDYPNTAYTGFRILYLRQVCEMFYLILLYYVAFCIVSC